MSVAEISKRFRAEQVWVSPDGVRGRVIIPVLQRMDFDMHGIPNAFHITMIIEKSRTVMWRQKEFLEYKISHNIPGKNTWYKAQQFSVKWAFYRVLARGLARGERHLHETPFYVDHHISYMGTTSFVWKSILRDGESDIELASSEILYVTIDKNTHRPVPIPQDLKQKYGKYIQNSPVEFPKVPSVAEDTFKWFFTPTFNDMDENNHVGNAPYPRYFVDCTAFAIDNGFYSKVIDPISKYIVKDFYINYVAQSSRRTPLVCHTWEDHQDPMRLYFHLKAVQNGGLVAEAILQLDGKINDKLTSRL